MQEGNSLVLGNNDRRLGGLEFEDPSIARMTRVLALVALLEGIAGQPEGQKYILSAEIQRALADCSDFANEIGDVSCVCV